MLRFRNNVPFHSPGYCASLIAASMCVCFPAYTSLRWSLEGFYGIGRMQSLLTGRLLGVHGEIICCSCAISVFCYRGEHFDGTVRDSNVFNKL